MTFWRAVLSGESMDRGARYAREKLMERLNVPSHKIRLTQALAAATGWNAHITGTIQRRNAATLPVRETDLVVR